jgi:hypothetical protein
VAGFVGILTGARLGIGFSVAGFFLVMYQFISCRRLHSFFSAHPSGLADLHPWLVKWKRPAEIAIGVLLGSFFAAMITEGYVSDAYVKEGVGVAASGTPFVSGEKTYRLVNHGVYTEVSRTRYVIQFVGQWYAWHSGVLSASLCVLFYLCFGASPFDRRKPAEIAADREREIKRAQARRGMTVRSAKSGAVIVDGCRFRVGRIVRMAIGSAKIGAIIGLIGGVVGGVLFISAGLVHTLDDFLSLGVLGFGLALLMAITTGSFACVAGVFRELFSCRFPHTGVRPPVLPGDSAGSGPADVAEGSGRSVRGTIQGEPGDPSTPRQPT